MEKDLRENIENSNDMVAGWCTCCGNQVIIRSFGLSSQPEYDIEATRQCNCDGAQEIRYREEQAMIAHKKANTLFPDINPDVKAFVDGAINLAAERKLKSLNLKPVPGITVKIAVASNGRIKITKETKKVETEEA